MSSSQDLIQRAMTNDHAFRAITTVTTETVRGILKAQNATGESAKHLADLITGTIMIRETMAPTHRVQGIISQQGQVGSLLADSHPDGNTRGLIRGGRENDFSLEGGVLQMMRSLANGSVNRGMVQLNPGQDVSAGLMAYLKLSEQVDSMLVCSSVFEDGELKAAGGYLIQLLPEVGKGPLTIMTVRLEDFENIDRFVAAPEFTPEFLMDELFYGMEYTKLDSSEIRYHCWCSRTAVMTALATLPRSDLDSIIEANETLDMTCDYCDEEYLVAIPELQGLLQAN